MNTHLVSHSYNNNNSTNWTPLGRKVV